MLLFSTCKLPLEERESHSSSSGTGGTHMSADNRNTREVRAFLAGPQCWRSCAWPEEPGTIGKPHPHRENLHVRQSPTSVRLLLEGCGYREWLDQAVTVSEWLRQHLHWVTGEKKRVWGKVLTCVRQCWDECIARVTIQTRMYGGRLWVILSRGAWAPDWLPAPHRGYRRAMKRSYAD